MPLIWGLLAALLFGASTPLAKELLRDVGPVTLAGLLYLGAALAVGPASLAGGRRRWPEDRATRARLAGVVLFGGVLGPVLLLFGLERAPAGSAALWLNLETVATAALAWAFFREHLGASDVAGVALITAASLLLAAPSRFALGVPALLIGAACLCWGLDNNLTSLIDGVTPAQSTFVKGCAAGLVNLGLGLGLEAGPPAALPALLALLLGAVSYGLSLVLYVSSAQQLGATRSQMVFASAPFWGLALSCGFLGEPVSSTQAAAAVLMLSALVLMHRGRHAHAHDHAELSHIHWHRHDDGHHPHAHPGRPAWLWHCHAHAHEALSHSHAHRPDLHHRHEHAKGA